MAKDASRRPAGRWGLTTLYTPGETAAVLGVSRRQVLDWIEDGVLPSVQLGQGEHTIRVRREALDRFVEEDFKPSVPPGQGGSLRQESRE